MAEQSQFWTTNGTGDGPSGGYTRDDWIDLWFKLFIPAQRTTGGPFEGLGGELAVSSAAVDQVTVQDGGAVVYGFFYENTAPVNLSVTRPVVGLTGGHVVLRVNWSAQTVRLFAVRNTDGVSAVPSPTQTAGTTWEIRLATFTIATNGTVTVTDARDFAHFGTRVSAAMLDANIVGTSHLVNDAVTAAKLANDAVDTLALANGAVTAAKITDGSVTTPKLADDSVDDTKAGARVATFRRRQGGNASNWSTHGTSNFTPGNVIMQAGSFNITVGVNVTITYPIAFSQPPILLLTSLNNQVSALISETAAGFTAQASETTSGEVTWLAIGPE